MCDQFVYLCAWYCVLPRVSESNVQVRIGQFFLSESTACYVRKIIWSLQSVCQDLYMTLFEKKTASLSLTAHLLYLEEVTVIDYILLGKMDF